MGNSGGKNRTHPREEEDFGSSPALVERRYGYNYDHDQHRDYDSGVRFERTQNPHIISLLQFSGIETKPMESPTKLMKTTR